MAGKLWAGFRRIRTRAHNVKSENDILADANKYLVDAMEEDKRQGLALAVKARWIALAVVAVLLAYVNPNWDVIYYEVLLMGFAYIGWLQLRAGQIGHSHNELLLIFCDLAFLTVMLLLPNPFMSEDWPTAVQYDFNGFLYFFILLAGSTLAYSWRTTVAFGTWAVGLWSVGVAVVFFFGHEIPELSQGMKELFVDRERMLEMIDPNNPRIHLRVQEMVVFMVVAAILAPNGWRNNQLLIKQAQAARERGNLARHFPPNIVDQIADRDQPLGEVRSQQVAIMFTDIVGFTSMAEQGDPHETVALLRHYHGLMESAVFNNKGTLDKFLGDGIMATFGTPDATADDPLNALVCACEMTQQMDEWNKQRQTEGLGPVKISVGIHYGDVVLGDIGSARRLEFATLGDAVNVASRLESMTRELKTRVVISEPLVAAIRAVKGDEADAILEGWNAGEERTVRGRDQQVKVWTRAE